MADAGGAPPAERWTDRDLAAIAESLRKVYGLEFGSTRIASAEDAMRRVMRALRVPSAKVLRERAAHSAEVQDALVGELTIGETYFFRERGQLDFAARALLPTMARDALPLRVWSAGCSTGEEPYSLEMLLRDAGWPHGTHVLGTDLVPARLALARRGRYGKWSMRGVPDDVIARWFTRQARQYVVDASIRDAVRFGVLDLACDDYATVGATAMDLVFCRNVLIYFDLPTVRRVAERLLASLSPRGWLFLSATDPVLGDLVDCRPVQTGAGYAYRRADSERHEAEAATTVRLSGGALAAIDAAARDAEAGIAPRARSAAPRARPAPPRSVRQPAPPAPIPPVLASDDEDAVVARVRRLANHGELDAAGRACAAALDEHPLSARLATLHATLLLQAGRAADAAAAARRSLYLDRAAPVAHLILGDALARSGDAPGAARAFGNAAELLARLAPDAPVADADGEPAGRLAEMARHRAGRVR